MKAMPRKAPAIQPSAVNAAGNGLHDVVFDDALTPEHTAQNAETEYRREFRTLDRKPEDQSCITNRYRNHTADDPTDNERYPGQLRVWPGFYCW
jgi:hypothetical protein